METTVPKTLIALLFLVRLHHPCQSVSCTAAAMIMHYTSSLFCLGLSRASASATSLIWFGTAAVSMSLLLRDIQYCSFGPSHLFWTALSSMVAVFQFRLAPDLPEGGILHLYIDQIGVACLVFGPGKHHGAVHRVCS